MIDNDVQRNVINQLHSFISVYEDMHIRNNTPINVIERNKSVIRDFLNSYETFMRSE
jgi:hypothetical protein